MFQNVVWLSFPEMLLPETIYQMFCLLVFHERLRALILSSLDPDSTFRHAVVSIEFNGCTEVRDIDLFSLEKNVVGFDIFVADIIIMEIGDSACKTSVVFAKLRSLNWF